MSDDPLIRALPTSKVAPMVLSTSDEAARYVENIKGWVSRDGRYYGDDERLARWAGATHVPCADCGEPTEKNWIKCEACRRKADDAKWAVRERKPWNGEWLYAEAVDRFFETEDDIADFLDANYEDGHTLDSLRLVVCEPIYPHEIDPDDFYSDDLPEDRTLRDVDGDLDDWFSKLNEVIRSRRKSGKPLSWRPGKFAADTTTIDIEATHG